MGLFSEWLRRSRGFTLLEAVVSIAIFGLLMLAVAGMWNVSWRTTERIAQGGAADDQTHLTLKHLGEAVEASVFRSEPKSLYAWQAHDDGTGAEESDRISFVTTLAPDVAGESEFAPLERILVMMQRSPEGKRQLILKAGPFTMEENDWQRETVLLEDIQAFRVQYWNTERKEWVNGWDNSDSPPTAVQMGIKLPGEDTEGQLVQWQHHRTAEVPISIEPPAPTEAPASSTNAPSTNAPNAQVNTPIPNASP